MSEKTRHARSILFADTLTHATFDDIIPTGEGWCERTVILQKEFRTLVRLASRRFASLRADLLKWRQDVRCGDVDFNPEREDDFKGALRTFAGLAAFLIERFDHFREHGLYLVKPRFVILLSEQQQDADRILNSWQSPEWETTGKRPVKWDEEQSKYLLEKVDSCN
jgi:hypothetical protein